MVLATLWTVFFVISLVGAAKNPGDDDWVHLPNKCEGKRRRLAASGPHSCAVTQQREEGKHLSVW